MSTIAEARAEEQARNARIVQHARDGCTIAEIVDIEGLGSSNLNRWRKLIREAGVTVTRRKSGLPKGITDETHVFRANLSRKVKDMRDVMSQIEVSRIIGMDAWEVNAATNRQSQNGSTPTHNWTIAQLCRLAEHLGMTLEQLVNWAFVKPIPKVGFVPCPKPTSSTPPSLTGKSPDAST